MADESDIAFNYPVDGCWARAYLMLNRIIERYDGVSVNKVWAFGNFQVNTNGPYGIIYWENHVAPIVTVTGNKDSLTMVIDPSIADGPVSKNGWWSIMTDETPDFLSMQVTSPGEPPVDPLTKQPYSGSGYWLGEDPTTHGGLDGFSIWMMGKYLNCAASGRTYPC